MCPIVPTFTCGFVRSYFAFAIPYFLPLAVTMRHSTWSPCPGSNRRPRPYQGRALPTELHGRIENRVNAKLLERETGFEPATPSLEGWRSTTELFPPVCAAPATMVGRGGFGHPKAYASRFTVCPLWPLGYLPESAGMR